MYIIKKMANYSASIHTTATSDSFWHSVNILITKPHVVNKRLWGNKIWLRYICRPLDILNWDPPSGCQRLDNILTKENVQQYSMQILDYLQIEACMPPDSNGLLELVLIELLPKNYVDSPAFQLVIMHKDKSLVKFYDVSPEKCNQKLCPQFSYFMQLKESKVVLSATCDINSKSYMWLTNTVLPQFIKWAEESISNHFSQNICKESLNLVSKIKYYNKYNELKLKYGKEMVKIWPECTDPSKFVYEDVAIASYLLVLWEHQQENIAVKQSFVDLGCGNGLLVYILIKEGHCGVGIDVRKRQIWDMYTSDVKLQERTISPSDFSLFPETDWIIGNHSDELTPWIPVIAAKSSYKCNFFLLPCCAYNFDGTRYQRKNSFKSLYSDYLDHIKKLSEECGFNVDMDRLKIPSTKRICLVSRGRIYSSEKYHEYCKKIVELIDHNSGSVLDSEHDPSWIKDFKPRDPVEKVRNCTQLDKNLIKSIVNCITLYLLEGCSSESNWSVGKTVEISKIVKLVPQDQLKQLKSECGGIQTLLRNNHNIFKVQNGKVQIRYPKTIEEVISNSKKNKKVVTIQVQQKPCWFYNNHPQGCPLLDTNCSFLHKKCD